MSQTIQDRNEHTNISFKNLIVQINDIKQNYFSGNLIVKIEEIPKWVFCFLSGRLASIGGGIDSSNRWQRNLAVACLNLPLDRFVKSSNDEEMFLNSNLLAQQHAIEEIIFDIIQFSQHKRDRLSYQLVPINNHLIVVDPNLPILDIEPILAGAIQAWQEWTNVGLAAYAPSLSPVVNVSARFDWPIEQMDVAKAILSFDGHRSLRSLAIYHQKNLLDFTKPLLPLLLLGKVSLRLPPASKFGLVAKSDETINITKNDSFDNSNSKDCPLVACIDDSIYVYKSLEKILTSHKFRSFGIQDPLKIITSLIKNKPDFIFLDLLMPITNGYEICKQIRKTPSLKNIPIVILTGKDGSIDRLHAKFVGANGFIKKPVQAELILKILHKHLFKSSLN
jgi:two-component system, chemotaxis family, response regulator PixG